MEYRELTGGGAGVADRKKRQWRCYWWRWWRWRWRWGITDL